MPSIASNRLMPALRPALSLLAALVSAALLASCATSGPNSGDFNLVSLEEEWQLGQQLSRDLERKLDLVNDRAVVGYVEQMGRRLVAQSAMAELPWQFHVVADPAVNAFNIPGGHVYVHTGLIGAAGNAAELAGVMGHEIAHGVARHGTENLTKSYGLSIVAGLLLGNDPKNYEEILAQVVGGGAIAKFSRDAEREADELGMRMMYDASYDPRGMASIFETLLEQRRRQPNALEQFFSSHPLTEERIADARSSAAALPQKQGLVRNDGRLDDIQRAVARHNR
jgi:predicted Zn-dependent protease